MIHSRTRGSIAGLLFDVGGVSFHVETGKRLGALLICHIQFERMYFIVYLYVASSILNPNVLL